MSSKELRNVDITSIKKVGQDDCKIFQWAFCKGLFEELMFNIYIENLFFLTKWMPNFLNANYVNVIAKFSMELGSKC